MHVTANSESSKDRYSDLDSAPTAEPKDGHRPHLRAFMGSQTAKVDALRQGRHTVRFVLLGGLLVLSTTIFLFVSHLSQDQAPEIKLPQAATPALPVAPLVETKPAVLVADLEVTKVADWPEPAVISDALSQIQILKARLSQSEEGVVKLQTDLTETLKRADEAEEKQKQQARKMAQTTKGKVPRAEQGEDVVALSILDVSPDRVLVSSPTNPQVKVAVAQGARLPGGAVFIGFDPLTRLMKTDQGEFLIR